MAAFHLHSSDSDFNNRVDTLFRSLDNVSTSLIMDDSNTSSIGKRKHDESRLDRDEEDYDGAFKRPNAYIPRVRRSKSNRKPDYVQNPDKWTCYDLTDTPCLTDAQNKQVGLELFSKLRAKRESQSSSEKFNPDDGKKIVFKKPVIQVPEEPNQSQETTSETDITAQFGGTKKIVMPEHVVGEGKKKKKSKSQSLSSRNSSDKVNLSYLAYEDELEIEDCG